MNTIETVESLMKILSETGFSHQYILQTGLELVFDIAFRMLREQDETSVISKAEQLLKAAEIVRDIALRIGIHPAQLREVMMERSR